MIIKDKDQIIDGAMEDVTFRTNPVVAKRDDLEKIFDVTMERLLDV